METLRKSSKYFFILSGLFYLLCCPEFNNLSPSKKIVFILQVNFHYINLNYVIIITQCHINVKGVISGIKVITIIRNIFISLLFGTDPIDK